MNEIDPRLKRTLNEVARTTHATDRLHQFDGTPQRRPAGVMVAAVAFVAVILGIGVPMVMQAAEQPLDVGGAPSGVVMAADDTTTTMPPTTTSAPAFDPSWLTLEDADLDVLSPHRAVARRPLKTERALCVVSPADATGVNGGASEFPLDEPLTEERLEEWCQSYESYGDGPIEAFTICRGVYADHTGYDEDHPLLAGDADAPRPGFPVVLAWEDDCTTADVPFSPDVILTDDLDLDVINRARNIEISATAAAFSSCLSLDEASALAAAIRDELGDTWRLVAQPPQMTPDDACIETFIDQQWGAISVMERLGSPY